MEVLSLSELVVDDQFDVLAHLTDLDFEEVDCSRVNEGRAAQLLVLEHVELLLEGLDLGRLLALTHAVT